MKTNASSSTTPQDVVRRRRGGQPGNRNALKTGAHTNELRALRKQVASVRQTMKRLIEAAKEELVERKNNQARARPKNIDVTNTKPPAASIERKNSALNSACGRKMKPAPKRIVEVAIDAARTATEALAKGSREVSSARPRVPAQADKNITPGQAPGEA